MIMLKTQQAEAYVAVALQVGFALFSCWSKTDLKSPNYASFLWHAQWHWLKDKVQF